MEVFCEWSTAGHQPVQVGWMLGVEGWLGCVPVVYTPGAGQVIAFHG